MASVSPDLAPVSPTERFALYYTPSFDSSLWRFGCRWLGRDAVTGEMLPHQDGPTDTAFDWWGVVGEPSRYGFHATLKPPFRLGRGCSESGLVDAIRRFAAGKSAFPLPPLQLAELDGFLALQPRCDHAPLAALAASCVRELDRFRAPLNAVELAYRRRVALTQQQELLLRRWGYPHVMELFRFHITLTGRLEADERRRVSAYLTPRLEPILEERLSVDALTLFHQTDADAPFEVRAVFPLGGGAPE